MESQAQTQVIFEAKTQAKIFLLNWAPAVEDRYAFSHLAEEFPLPEGMDYHVRIPLVRTGADETCSVQLKLPSGEDFLTLRPEDQGPYSIGSRKSSRNPLRKLTIKSSLHLA